MPNWIPRRLPVLAAIVLATLGIVAGEIDQDDSGAERAERLAAMQREVGRLTEELRGLEGKEAGIIGELERLAADLRLRETELEEVTLRLEELSSAIETHDQRLNELDSAQEERLRYLAFRLREIYKAGPEPGLRRLIAGDDVENYWKGLTYASFLSVRDAEIVADYREGVALANRERAGLEAARREVELAQEDLTRARNLAAKAKTDRSSMLRRVRRDQTKTRQALDELNQASLALSNVVDSVAPPLETSSLDVRKFRGLLDWPARGVVSAAFGAKIHPRFKTQVPHPGLDIDAPMGSDIVSVFDGRIVFAEWMRGYGLTVIIDHGEGLLSIYAHAAVLTVAKDEQVRRGQTLGTVGETGSLRGPYLYFELRLDGEPTDPATWLRPR